MSVLGRIMIVDDERFDHMICDRIIRRSNLASETVAHYTASDALAFLQDAQCPEIDLILLDINMPGMSGLDFLDAARERLHDLSTPVVIMLTAPLPTALRERAASHPAVVDYFLKPFRQDHLTRALEIFERRRSEKRASNAA